MAAAEEKTDRRTMEGVVVSTKMQKTSVVRVSTKKPHPVYKKYVVRSKKFLVDDPEEKAQVGDNVVIESVRPVSKRKSWRLKSVLRSNAS